jgi:membrane protease subunit (stomatin/prohibitin family)
MKPTALVLEYLDPTGKQMVTRLPEGGDLEIPFGSQLVVQESQEAVFFRDGRALDTFGPGRHTLTTQNLPGLNRILAAAFGTGPFRAAVVFVGKKTYIDLKWGTREPITFRDTELAMIRLRANGRFSLRVVDSSLFVNTLVGTQGLFTTDAIEGFYRDVIVARLTDLLGESYRSIFDLPRVYDELSTALKARLADDTGKYGVSIPDLYVGAITPPEEVQEKIDARGAMGAIGDMNRYMQYKAAEALGDAAKGSGGGDGTAGAGMGLGMGAGLGAGLGAMLPGIMREAMTGGAAAGPAATGAAAGVAAAVATGGFCAACGKPSPAAAKFCPECGAPSARGCSGCGKPLPAGAKFCPDCGAKQA